MSKPWPYSHPALTVDVVLLTIIDGQLHAMLQTRHREPFRGCLAFPGTFVREDEPLDASIGRVLQEKCGVNDVYYRQLPAFAALDRDPRTRVITLPHLALVDAAKLTNTVVGIDPTPLRLSANEVRPPSPLAFDHQQILQCAIATLRQYRRPLGAQLLPKTFVLSELLAVQELILGHKINKDSFRRKMLATGDLIDTGELRQTTGRPASLYKFRFDALAELI